MPTSKHRRKQVRASGRKSADARVEAQPQPWREKKLRSNFQSQPRQVEKTYWRQ